MNKSEKKTYLLISWYYLEEIFKNGLTSSPTDKDFWK